MTTYAARDTTSAMLSFNRPLAYSARLTFNRPFAYFVYSLLTTGAFALAEAKPNDVTTGLATNLLAGLIIVTFIDTLFRLAEDRRLRPMKIATFVANERVREAMEVVLGEAYVAARHASVVRAEEEAALDRYQVDRKVAAILDRMRFGNLAIDDDDVSKTLRLAADWAIVVDEKVDTALEKFGSYQEPRTAALLAIIHEMILLNFLRSPEMFSNIRRIAEEEWLQLIDAHNELLMILRMDAARYGIPICETLEFFNSSLLLTWADKGEKEP